MPTSRQTQQLDNRRDTRSQWAKLRSLPHRQLNSSRFPLPYELLARIFHFACPPIDFSKRSLCEFDDDDDEDPGPFYSEPDKNLMPIMMNKHDLSHRYMPLTLSAVSLRWREVAFSSPELWSTFALEVLGWKLESQVPLLRLYLENTGSLPFSLGLDIRVQQWAYIEEYGGKAAPIIEWRSLQPLADVIFRAFPAKIQTLRMAGAPPGWMCFLSQQNFPNLKDLTFAWSCVLGDRTTTSIEKGSFTIQPTELRRIRGATFRSRPTFGLPPLTTLHLHNVYMNICAEILLSCPDLVEYHCYRPSNNDQLLSVTFQNPFTVPNLKRFARALTEDGSYGDSINAAFLKNTRLPNLEELQWGVLTDPDGEAAFFSEQLKALRSFTFYGCESYWGEYHSRFLSRLHSVQSLSFCQCLATFIGEIHHLLSDRTPGLEPMFLLPGLNTITVRKCQEREKRGIGKAMIGMLKNRGRLLGISDF